MVYDIMNDGQRKFYEENKEIDFSFEVPGLARFRVNAFLHNRGAGAVMRTIPSKILSLEDLKAPEIFKSIADYPRGMVLVTGPTGSGKSTTLAAMVNHRNENEMGHIRLSREADLVVVAPATADLMARYAAGLADDLADAGVKIIFNYSDALLQVPPEVTVHTSSPAVDLLYALYFYLT